MKAAFIERHGGPEVLEFGEMPDPVVAPGEVMVEVIAARVNGADWKVREGKSNQLARFSPHSRKGFLRHCFSNWGWCQRPSCW